MDTTFTLIRIYLFICQRYRGRLAEVAQRQQCEVVFGSIDRTLDTRPALSRSLVECSKQLLFQ
ncbi:hypothetical protein GGP62_000874 [Salinibacter ruber]|nr:hypothetical protein [Salinibacter ruber]